MSLRQEKTAKLLQRLAAEYVQRRAGSLSLITVTRADVSEDLKNARVFFTTLPEEQEQSAVEFLHRKEYDFGEYVRKNAKMQFIPKISFVLDLGEKNRIALERLSEK